jgi:PAS domain S-box-containing protein
VEAQALAALLVEDNPGDARLIREMLRDLPRRPVQLQHVSCLQDGLASLARGSFDVVLLDLSLPESQGLDTFQRVRAAVPEIPIIVLTGLADESVAVRAVHEGAQDYLFKGDVSGELLARSIRYAVERKRLMESERLAREEVEAERARLGAILDSAPLGILYFQADAGRVSANPQAVRLLGWPVDAAGGVDQLLGKVCRPGGEAVERGQLLATRALAGEAASQAEALLMHEDGTSTPALGSAAPVRDREGRVTGAVVMYQDVSRLKDLERLREEWTSAVAHDLRQPVAAITAYANLLELLAGESSAPRERAAIDHIMASSRQLYRLIGDVMDVSRLASGQLRLERARVDLRRLIPEVVERAADLLGDRRVHISAPDELGEVEADPSRLEQVLANLLSNAGKYAETGSEVLVQAVRGPDGVEVTVCSQGGGIDPVDLPLLFTRFFRTQSAQERRVPGLGLGLYICKALIEAHGGRIWAESAAGATSVRFTLPA